jgi:hypothetical protein
MYGCSVWKWQCDMVMRNTKDGWNEHAIVHMFVNHMEIAFLNERRKQKVFGM